MSNIAELHGLTASLYSTDDGVVVFIDTLNIASGQQVSIRLNDSPIYRGDPEETSAELHEMLTVADALEGALDDEDGSIDPVLDLARDLIDQAREYGRAVRS